MNARYVEPCADPEGGVGFAMITWTGRYEYLTAQAANDPQITDKDDRKALDRLVRHIDWGLPRKLDPGAAPRPSDLPRLERKISRYIADHVWFRDDREYSLIGSWVLSTYYPDEYACMPRLYVDGMTDAGKSTALEVIGAISYHGVVSTGYTPALIKRVVKHHQATLCLDEALDNLSGAASADLINLIKAGFTPEGKYGQAILNTASDYEYIPVYAPMCVSIRGQALPQDVLNRGIRVQMLPKPRDVRVESVHWTETWGAEDGGPTAAEIRTELYNLKLRSMLWQGRADAEAESLQMRPYVLRAVRDLTTRAEDGQWLYALSLGIPRGPEIDNRQRDVAVTMLASAEALGVGRDVMERIIENEEVNEESRRGSLEGRVFRAAVDCILDRIPDYMRSRITRAAFCDAARRVTTREIALEVNRAMMEEGEQQPYETVRTSQVTWTLKTLGMTYKVGQGAGQRASTLDPQGAGFRDIFLRNVNAYDPTHAETFEGI